jgi:hypothetical protein
MWSLPDITAMNARKELSQTSYRRQARLRGLSRKYPCECCGKPSTAHLPYYDIFSDAISGVTHLCAGHYDDGHGNEGFFDCAKCGRRMIENITWERYAVNLNGGDPVCLKCAAQSYFADPQNWVDSHKVKSLDWCADNAPLLTASGVLNLARCRHVLGVKQPVPAGICFRFNAEFDNEDLHQISGFGFLEDIQALKEPFCPVLDAAWQFALSIGIYVRRWPVNKPFAGLFTKAGDGRRLPITFSRRYNLPRWAGIALDHGWESGQLRIEGESLRPVSEESEAA